MARNDHLPIYTMIEGFQRFNHLYPFQLTPDNLQQLIRQDELLQELWSVAVDRELGNLETMIFLIFVLRHKLTEANADYKKAMNRIQEKDRLMQEALSHLQAVLGEDR